MVRKQKMFFKRKELSGGGRRKIKEWKKNRESTWNGMSL
jgi:hypothetical protein